MKLSPRAIRQYHVFLASPGDVAAERQYVRRFFEDFNRHFSHIWGVRFEVVDWENYATIGVGRPQELITRQTLEKYRESLALVIGIMGQRFGSPTGKAESGTEEEFNWAMESHKANSGFPEIKWFFRKVDSLEFPADPADAIKALEQWQKALSFRKRMQGLNNPVFYAEYPNAAGFAEVFARDLNQWLADPARPWATELADHATATGGSAALALPAEFDAESYRAALLKRFDKLNFEMLDTTGAFYSAVRLWSVFVPQSVRECHQYNPRLLEIPKEHQRRLLDAGEITEKELEEAEQQADRLRQEYFHQPLRPVLEVVDETLFASPAGAGRKLVILGDPGSGKSSLIRYLALRWASTAEPTLRGTQQIPLVIELGAYARWQYDGRKDFIRYLEEGPVWHDWQRGLLARLLAQPGRVVLLLDGLDEVLDVTSRESVINDIQRFCSQFTNLPVVLTSRVVGYQAHLLREAEFRHFMLQELDSSQISDFVNRWHEVTFDDPAQAAPKRDRLQKAIRESKSVAMLAGNSMLLTMMAILNRNQELPRDRADLYAQASRVLLHQWDTERALEDFPGLGSQIGLREKTDILRGIAAHMQAAPGGLKGNLIDGPTLSGLIEDYLHNELQFAQPRTAARAVVEQLRHRNFILCFVGANSYAFVHRAFLEYFCAADIVSQFNVVKTLDIDGLVALFDRHCRDDEWREVLRLICGQIDENFVGRIVEHLARPTDLEIWAGKNLLPELPLAIWCLGEVRNIARLQSTGRRLAEEVLRIYISGRGTQEFHAQLLAAARDVGVRWPGAGSLFDTFVTRISGVDERALATPFVVRFLAYVQPNYSETKQLLTSGNSGLRAGAVSALAEIWPDEKTRELLAERAVQDSEPALRTTAIQVLAETWPDETTRELLAQRAVEDSETGPRSAALEALERFWPNATASLLKLARLRSDELTHVRLLRAIHDGDSVTRHLAISALVEMRPSESIRSLLESVVAEDEDQDIRSLALGKLLQVWPDARSLLICRGLLEGDAEPAIRATTARQLASSMWEDPDVRRSVRRVARVDESVKSHLRSLQSRLVGVWEGYFRGTVERSSLPKTPAGYPAILVESFRLKNIRSFVDTGRVRLSTPATLLLGNNASGKSTILQCIALASIGSRAANEAELNSWSYLRRGTEKGIIEVRFSLIPEPDAFADEYGDFCVGLQLEANADRFTPLPNSEMEFGLNCVQRLDELRTESKLAFGLICGYGATRAFGDDRERMEPELSRAENEWVWSLFRHNTGLVNPNVLSKLFRGDTRNIEGAPDSLTADIAKSLRERIGQLLPNVDGLYSDGNSDLRLNDTDLRLADLSDGYRGVLAVIGHLLRSALKLSGWVSYPTEVHGVVLIDELDLHLHPAWQRHVLNDLRQAFPNIQWITTSHSPIIAGSLGSDSLRVLKNADGRSTVLDDLPSISGCLVDHILTGVLFDLPTTRDVATEQIVSKYAKRLNEFGPEDEEVQSLEAELAHRERRRRSDVRVDEGIWNLVLNATRGRLMEVSEQQRTRILAELRLALHS